MCKYHIGIRHIWSSLMDVLEWNATNNAHAMYVHYSCDTGFFKKTAIHMKARRYLAYPRNPQLQCCDRKCRASWTKNGCFFWRPPNTKFRRQHWIGGRGGHDLCGVVVLHGMAVFFGRTRYVVIGLASDLKNHVTNILIQWPLVPKLGPPTIFRPKWGAPSPQNSPMVWTAVAAFHESPNRQPFSNCRHPSAWTFHVRLSLLSSMSQCPNVKHNSQLYDVIYTMLLYDWLIANDKQSQTCTQMITDQKRHLWLMVSIPLNS